MDTNEWERYRSYTLKNVCAAAFLFGLEIQIYHPTEYYYFKDSMKVDKPGMYFGFSWGALSGSGAIFSLVGSYYYDSTGNIRRIFLFAGVVDVLGNILYLLYYSPYVVLCGQVLIGMAAGRMAAGVGEISQIYDSDKMTKNVSLLAIFSVIGGALGPCSTYLFNLVHVRIGNWVLNVNNMVGVVMASLYLIYLIVNICTLKNVSKERNLKKEASDQSLTPLVDEDEAPTSHLGEEKIHKKSIDEMSFKQKYAFTIRALFKSSEALTLYGLCFFTSFCRATLIMLFPIKATFYLDWTPVDIATVSIVALLFGGFTTAVAFSILSGIVNDFYLLLFPQVTLILALCTMVSFPYIPNHTAQAVVFYATGIFLLSSATGFHIIGRSMLSKLVPHNIQAVTDAVRNTLFESAYMVAGLLLQLSSAHMTVFATIDGVLAIFCIVCLCVRRDKFTDMTTISIDS